MSYKYHINNTLVERIFFKFSEFSDQEIAEIVGSSRSVVQGWKSNKSNPQKKHLENIIKYCKDEGINCSVEWLYAGKSADRKELVLFFAKPPDDVKYQVSYVCWQVGSYLLHYKEDIVYANYFFYKALFDLAVCDSLYNGLNKVFDSDIDSMDEQHSVNLRYGCDEDRLKVVEFVKDFENINKYYDSLLNVPKTFDLASIIYKNIESNLIKIPKEKEKQGEVLNCNPVIYPDDSLTASQKHIMHLALELIEDGQQLIQKGKTALENALADPQWADDVISSGVKEIGKDALSDLPEKTA